MLKQADKLIHKAINLRGAPDPESGVNLQMFQGHYGTLG